MISVDFQRDVPDAQADQYDCIVIGSGIGGLTTANLLARVGKQRVLVLERHFKLGGFTHSFRRHQYEWDVGLHYVGEMQAGTLQRRIMDLVTGARVQWHPLGSPFERFVFPDWQYEVPGDVKSYRQQLCERFPAETREIKRYFRALKAAQGWGIRWFIAKQSPRWIGKLLTRPGRSLAVRSTAEVLSRFTDPQLRAILASQWPDMGTPPEISAFMFQAMIATHYAAGAFYPIGGSRKIGEAAVETLERAGGRCLINHTVREILVKRGRACGVRVETKAGTKEFYAPKIISDAGITTTFRELVAQDYCGEERARVERCAAGPSANIVFLGLNSDPRAAGFDEANYWIFSDQRHVLRPVEQEPLTEIDGVFLSFGSLRDPQQAHHTAQIIAFGYAQEWQAFLGSQWKRRGAEYESLKQTLLQRLIDYVERRLPGLRKLIDYAELSTPLTVESFTGHHGGTIYGHLCDQARLSENEWRCDTSLRGLYLTGADVGMPGISGAQMAGVMTAARVLGPLGLPRIMKAAYGF